MRTPILIRQILFAVVTTTAGAQQATIPSDRAALRGRVVGADSVPLPGVRVTVIDLNRVTSTDERGQYALTSLAPGTYNVSFARLGVTPVLRRVTLVRETELDIVMREAYVELPAVQAVATSAASSVFASPQPMSVLEAATLRTAHGASVGDAVEGLPGLRSLSMSPGIGKPVIRGLTSNRVVVVDNGQRLETQQWGSDHAPNVETLGASRIEVLRGPASVLYGSDALGGVINIVRPPPPDAIGTAPFIRARANSAYFSNPEGVEGSAALEAARGGVGTRVTVTRRTTGDLRSPVEVLHNTGNGATNVDAAASIKGERGSLAGGYVTRTERIEIYEDPVQFPGFSGYQRITERRLNLRASLVTGADRIDAVTSYERNERREYDNARAARVALGLMAKTAAGQIAYHHRPILGADGTVGVSFLANRFDKFGVETLIPSNRARNIGAFLFEQAELGRWNLSFGLRFDHSELKASADSVLRLVAQRRQWQAVTGNLGVLYRIATPVAVVLNAGRGFRAPSAADLFSNGYHEGTRAFERGDPTLGVESSLNLDVAVRAQTSLLNAEVGAFANRIRDYIYLQPVGSLDTLLHAQGDALLTGFEMFADYAPLRWVAFRTTVDYTRGRNTTLSVPLPFVPPLRASARVRLQPPDRAMFKSPYLSFGWEAHSPQRDLAPGDVGTAGYSLLNLGAGSSFAVRTGVISADVSIRNALDRAYRNFMSAYKTVAHAPGRAVVARVNVEF